MNTPPRCPTCNAPMTGRTVSPDHLPAATTTYLCERCCTRLTVTAKNLRYVPPPTREESDKQERRHAYTWKPKRPSAPSPLTPPANPPG
jgi:hypothetical protein